MYPTSATNNLQPFIKCSVVKNTQARENASTGDISQSVKKVASDDPLLESIIRMVKAGTNI